MADSRPYELFEADSLYCGGAQPAIREPVVLERSEKLAEEHQTLRLQTELGRRPEVTVGAAVEEKNGRVHISNKVDPAPFI